MENRIDMLFQHWYDFDAEVFVAEKIGMEKIALETLVAESTLFCRDCSRLLWVTIDGLSKNIEKVNIAKVIVQTQEKGDLSVLGVIADACYQHSLNPIYLKISHKCPKNKEKQIFFYRIAKSKMAAQITLQNPLPLFLKWNFYCNELRYLS